jgi:hypothetical protein
MRGVSLAWVTAALAIGLAVTMDRSDALADTYRSGDYAFEIAGLSLERVQDEVVSAIRLPLGSAGIKQITLWPSTPCYRVGNRHGYVGEATLSGVIALLNTRLPYKIVPCLARDKPAITYYLMGNVVDPDDRRELMKRLFKRSKLDCDWQQTAFDRDTGLIRNALVVARSTASSARETADCLLRNTAQVLGVGWSTARAGPDSPSAPTERELNLLSLFVRYRVTQELSQFRTLYQVEGRIAALLAEMHAAGTLPQIQ